MHTATLIPAHRHFCLCLFLLTQRDSTTASSSRCAGMRAVVRSWIARCRHTHRPLSRVAVAGKDVFLHGFGCDRRQPKEGNSALCAITHRSALPPAFPSTGARPADPAGRPPDGRPPPPSTAQARPPPPPPQRAAPAAAECVLNDPCELQLLVWHETRYE